MKKALLILTALVSLTIANFAQAKTGEDYSWLSRNQIEQNAYNDAVAYFQYHTDITESDTPQLGNLEAHRHHLFGYPGVFYAVTFSQTANALIEGK